MLSTQSCLLYDDDPGHCSNGAKIDTYPECSFCLDGTTLDNPDEESCEWECSDGTIVVHPDDCD